MGNNPIWATYLGHVVTDDQDRQAKILIKDGQWQLVTLPILDYPLVRHMCPAPYKDKRYFPLYRTVDRISEPCPTCHELAPEQIQTLYRLYYGI